MRIRDLTAAVLLVLPVVARAQASDNATRAGAALLTPSTLIGATRPSVSTSVTSADKRAIGTLGLSFGTATGAETNLWLRASGPIDENDSKAPAVLADLQGYRRSTKLEIGIGGLNWDWSADEVGQLALCGEVYTFRPPALADSLIKARVAKAPDSGKAAARDSAIKTLVQKHCSAHELPEADERRFRGLMDFGQVFLWGISGEIGRQDYKFADTVNLKYDKHSERPAAVSVNL